MRRGHGGTDVLELRVLGLRESDIIDLSVNVSPFGPAPSVQALIRTWDPSRYPDPACTDARRALAERFNLSPDRIILGNGATELLWTLFDALAPRRVLILEPTFSEFRSAAEAKRVPIDVLRSEPCEWPRILDGNATWDAIYFTHPNNPTGKAMDLHQITEWANAMPETIFVSDESFLSLSERAEDLDHALPDNVLRLRSMTKDHGLAGVRLGYAIAPADLARAMEAQRPTWTVNDLAQRVVRVALEAETHVVGARQTLFDWRTRLERGLRELRVPYLESRTIYTMLDVRDARPVKMSLLRDHRIRVRDCTNFGFPAFIRVAVRSPETQDRFLSALSASLLR
ncbi:MAG: pyridoxal phosphate-dependent aminotransferase [Myxococcota bacterium]